MANKIKVLLLLLTISSSASFKGSIHAKDGNRLQLEMQDSDCAEKLSLVQQCTRNSSSCGDCVDYAFGTVMATINVPAVNCDTVSSGLCPSITTGCDCGSCRQLIEEVRVCMIKAFYNVTFCTLFSLHVLGIILFSISGENFSGWMTPCLKSTVG
jgi:hypothetical protein